MDSKDIGSVIAFESFCRSVLSKNKKERKEDMKHTFICTKDEAVVETKQGKLRGFYYDEVYNFWGVRYADGSICPRRLKPGKGSRTPWLTDM